MSLAASGGHALVNILSFAKFPCKFPLNIWFSVVIANYTFKILWDKVNKSKKIKLYGIKLTLYFA